ncbi:MAG: hypothetical protein K0U86_09440 [Planctomycetes bacterium]|nr:hypothetical protein [Planctomycetota bacterium]MCH9725113.1 hypothetical protein [Planctomycetota bacterium]MCH9774925.1 hypothetical protein [Planctomycetota bacterium]MCH9789328.1 hypothetical protein [Planctomycetota bacterium]
MLTKPLMASLSRISDLEPGSFEITQLKKDAWATGDYVVGEVESQANARTPIELTTGRMTEVTSGDHVIGALGVRAATLEAVGHWNAIQDDLRMQALTAAGLFGRATSVSTFIANPMWLTYCGHVTRNGVPVRMRDFVKQQDGSLYDRPTILLIGTSMSSGKTTSAKIIIRQLVRLGLKVAGIKFTGAGRLKDTLAMHDAGASSIFDFVDVGLPSTACAPDEYQSVLSTLLGKIQNDGPDVVVAEAGASPLEPYNGDVLIDTIRSHINCTVLCASDPYAVVGVTKGFGFTPDFIAGLATSTSAGVEVIQKLTGSLALNLLDPSTHDELKQLLTEKLGL